MQWSGQKEFVASPEVLFEVEGSKAGLLKNYGPLSFLKVHLFLSVVIFCSFNLSSSFSLHLLNWFFSLLDPLEWKTGA